MTIEASKDQVQEIFFSRRTKFFLSIETDGAVRRLYVFVTRRCGQRCSRSYQRVASGRPWHTYRCQSHRQACTRPPVLVRARARARGPRDAHRRRSNLLASVAL